MSLVRFSTLASKFLCTSSDVVLLEKFMFNNSCKNRIKIVIHDVHDKRYP